MKPQPAWREVDDPSGITKSGIWWHNRRGDAGVHSQPNDEAFLECINREGAGWVSPYGRPARGEKFPADYLWVRESWWHYKSSELEMAAYDDGTSRTLLDNGLTHDEPAKEIPMHGRTHWHPTSYPEIWKKRPSIFMPRWASRITLEITDVRVERLNSISEADAEAEGCRLNNQGRFSVDGLVLNGRLLMFRTARECYRTLWESINGPDSWSANPHVWALSLRSGR